MENIEKTQKILLQNWKLAAQWISEGFRISQNSVSTIILNDKDNERFQSLGSTPCESYRISTALIRSSAYRHFFAVSPREHRLWRHITTVLRSKPKETSADSLQQLHKWYQKCIVTNGCHFEGWILVICLHWLFQASIYLTLN